MSPAPARFASSVPEFLARNKMTVIPHPPYSSEGDPTTSLQFKQTHSTCVPISKKFTSQSDVTHGYHLTAISSPHWQLWRWQHWLTRNVVIPEQIHSRNCLITPKLQPTPQNALTCALLVQWHTDMTSCHNKIFLFVQCTNSQLWNPYANFSLYVHQLQFTTTIFPTISVLHISS